MAWIRQYSAPNVVGDRKLKALIFLHDKSTFDTKNGHFAFLSTSLGTCGQRTLFILGSLGQVDFLLVIIELFFARCYR